MLKISKFTFTVFMFFLFISGNVVAHDGRHAHVLGKDEISQKAKEMLIRAVDKNKIDKSWLDAKLVKVSTKSTNHTDEWLIEFENQATASKNKNLYVFFSLDGEFLAMNYTGK